MKITKLPFILPKWAKTANLPAVREDEYWQRSHAAAEAETESTEYQRVVYKTKLAGRLSEED